MKAVLLIKLQLQNETDWAFILNTPKLLVLTSVMGC